MRECGVYSMAQLAERGVNRRDLRKLISSGTLRRLRRGWYAATSADAAAVAAVAAGGVLGCLSALRWHGVWVPEHRMSLHVRGNSQANRRSAYCRQYGRPQPELSAIDDIATALRHAVRCLDDEGVVVVCDSLLNLGLMTMADLRSELESAPRSARALLDQCDAAAESGTETMVRLRLRSHRIPVRTQVRINGVGRVDLLAGQRLLLEVDGQPFHTGVERFEADRQRDRRATELGYLTVRLSYRQVVHDWPSVEQDILSIIRRRGHRSWSSCG